MKIKKALKKLRKQSKKRGKKVPQFDVEATIRGASRRRGTGT